MSADAPDGPVLGTRGSSSIDSSSRGWLLTLSMSTQRAEPRVLSVRASWPRPVSSLEPPPSDPDCCMLGERSTSTIVVSARPPPARPSQPPDSGRLIAKISPAIASIRTAMISHWRIRA